MESLLSVNSHFYWLLGIPLGILGGVHCVGMCSPLVQALTAKASASNVWALHLGRWYSYVLQGGIAGALGFTFRWSHWTAWLGVATGLILLFSVWTPSILYPLH